MKNICLCAILVAAFGFGMQVSSAQDSTNRFLGLSTNYVAHGEHLYLIGKNLTPGEQILVWKGWMVRSPNGGGKVDTNGNYLEDVTLTNRWNCYQRYEYGSTISYVTYEDGNQGPPTNKINSITCIATNGAYQVTISASVKPKFTYVVVGSTNTSGPWSPIDWTSYYPYYEEITNITATYTLSSPHMFFRIDSSCGD